MAHITLYSTSVPITLKLKNDIARIKRILDAKRTDYEEVSWSAGASGRVCSQWRCRLLEPQAAAERSTDWKVCGWLSRRWTWPLTLTDGRRCLRGAMGSRSCRSCTWTIRYCSEFQWMTKFQNLLRHSPQAFGGCVDRAA